MICLGVLLVNFIVFNSFTRKMFFYNLILAELIPGMINLYFTLANARQFCLSRGDILHVNG